MQKGKTVIKGLSACTMALVLAFTTLTAACASSSAPKAVQAVSESSVSVSASDYKAYLTKYSEAKKPKADKQVDILSNLQGYPTEQSGKASGIRLDRTQNTVSFEVTTEQAGVYNIGIKYYALSGKSKEIVFALQIDGAVPFDEAEQITLPRIYKDAGEIKKDQNGNDLRPLQVEVNRSNQTLLSNCDGYYDDPFAFYLTEGKHTLTFAYCEEGMLIENLSLYGVNDLIAYKDYSKNATAAEQHITLYEAEKSAEKSSSMLYPTYDRSSAATSPSHYSKIRYNTIGQTNWSYQGQWVSWNIEAPNDGWYSISLKARQNYQQGMNSYRTLYIDDKIPFAEVKNIAFPYSLSWYNKILGDGENPYLFYLSKGQHTLKLEVAAGPMGTLLKNLSDCVLDLNELYRSIIMVTGTTPDKYRTYYLEETVPGLIDNIKQSKETLDEIYKQITEITGAKGSQASTIKEMSSMLGEFLAKPLDIPERISAFKSNIESLGSLILTLSQQPLELDYFVVSSASELPSVKSSLFEALEYGVKGFIASFVEDYNSVGSSADGTGTKESVTVWLSNGRDQAQILKNLIDNYFTPATGIPVHLSIVSTAASTSSSTLVQATLAGKGPDAALFTPKDTPVNLAMRGALTDVSKLDGYEELYKNFYESAWIPYLYEGGVYGVPETQNFDMLFYRSDIFSQLGLAVPNTWDEFYAIIEILQKNNLGIGVAETNAMNAGISAGISFFEKLLLQNGGTYYTNDLKKTAFNTSVAYDAFTEWSELYTKYGLDRSFDFFNRFRTGEMPIGIMSYTVYNQLYAAAPEIKGLWAMAEIPGTVDTDGNIRRTETAAGTAAVILSDTKVQENAWEFIKWWVSAQTQANYGTELEASLGVAARYDTANIEAFQNIGWNDSESKILTAQWNQVTDVKQIPGNYFIARCLTNAFRTAVDDSANPVRALNTYNKDMNAEITRKRAEFGLD